MKKLEDVNAMSETTNSNQIKDDKEILFISTKEVFCFLDIDSIAHLMEMDPNDTTFIQDAKELIDGLTSEIVNNDQNHYLYGMRSFFYERMGMVDEAKADFDKALSLNACEAYYQQGYYICLSKNMDLNEAVKFLSEAIRLNENFRDAYQWRGYTYRNLEQYELAIKDYSKVIDFFEDDKTYFDRAFCFQQFAFNQLKNGNKLEYRNLMKKAVDDYTKSLYDSPIYRCFTTEEDRNQAIQHLNLNPSVIKEFGEKGFNALEDETIEDADTIRLVYLLSALSMGYLSPYPLYGR